MVEANAKFQYHASDKLPVYVDPEQKSDMHNVRLRHNRSNTPTKTTPQLKHVVLSTGDFQGNERDSDANCVSRNRHNKTQIFFLILTALVYLLNTLRVYIPESLQIESSFWSQLKPIPIIRFYSSDLRPNLVIENLFLHLAEIFQTLWLIFILSYIPRRTHLGYLYRYPDIFNTILCCLLISALALHTIRQTTLPPQISCVCLLLSYICLIITCRLIAVKLLKYSEKMKSIDIIFIRYFVLNSVFLYTISIGYLTLCSSIESFTFYLGLNFNRVESATTIGILIVLFLLLIYFVLDQFVYEAEFWSIWTPYLFVGIIFNAPSLRQLLSAEPYIISNELNFYLHWALFGTTIMITLIRVGRQLYTVYQQRKKKEPVKTSIEQANVSGET